MNRPIKCPKCEGRDWSSDFWYCPNCSYYVGKEEMLLEMNQDNFDGRNRGDEPQEGLSKWIEDQKSLCQDMVNYLLPDHNLEPVSFNEPERKEWGRTTYLENDKNKADQAFQRFAEKGALTIYWGGLFAYKKDVRNWIIQYSNLTRINISPKTLETEQSFNTKYGIIGGGDWIYYGSGAGFLPTTAHESAHASHEVNWDVNFLPWINEGHDDVWRRVYIKFFNDLMGKYGEQVKNRFKEYRKITGKEDDKYGK